MKKSKITRKQIGIEFILLLLLGLFVCLFLSLVSYDPADPGWSQTAWHEPISNLGGYIGAYVADVFLQFFGFVAFTLPILAIFICVQLMIYVYKNYHKPINYFSLSFRVIGFLAFIFSATSFCALNVIDLDAYKAGGNLGEIVANNILPVMNSAGLSLILLVICIACFTLITGFSWLYSLEKLGALVVMLFSPLMWLFKMRQQRNETAREKALKAAEENELRQDEVDDRQLHMPFEQKNVITHEDNIPKIVLGQSTDTVTIAAESASQFKSATQESENISDNAVLANSTPSVATTIAMKEEEPPLIKSSEELLQSIDLNKPSTITSSDEMAEYQRETTVTESGQSIASSQNNQSDVLSRMESVIKSMQERKIENIDATSNNQVSDSGLSDNDVNDLDESFKYEEYTIADAPSKPLFTLVNPTLSEPTFAPELHKQPEVETIEPQQHIEPLSDVTRLSPSFDKDVLPESDIAKLNDDYGSTPVLDAEVPTKNDNHDNNSLIHPLLRRDDKPLPKPTTPLPSLDLLTAPPTKQIEIDHGALNAMSELIEQSLSDYRVKAKVVDYLPGPVITRFEIELAPGIKAARISTLDRDLARSLSMPSVRVVEVIPGKPYVGIELPNKDRQTVYFREVLDSPQFRDAPSPLTIVLGKDIAGQSVVADLAKMPHLLVAGTTGSGKSVGVNAMILSILYKSQPEDVRFIMIDPKMLELSIYEGIPHLLTQVVTDMKDAANALNWCVNEMEKRYRLMSALGVRNIAGYNEKIKQAEEMGRPIPDPLWKPTDSMDLNMPTLEKLPYIVVMVDEFADLIMAVGKKVEELIARLAQKARAAGIHLVLATQRPSVDVITGLIKANIPTRIAFTVSSKIDSRTILDQMGAESLLGMGDMLYLAPNSSIPVRVHGAFVRDEEVHAVVQDWKARGTPKYIDNITVAADDSENGSDDGVDEELDPLFDQVVAFVIETRRASISSVQRKFRIGYNRAARIVEQMENEGIVSSPSHNGNREVLAGPAHSDY